MAARRLAKELEKVRESFDAECVDDNIMSWQVALPGPDHSPYYGGTFLVELVFSSEYPFRGPEIRFQTKIYHPNINHKGEVCLGEMISEWKPVYTPLMVMAKVSELLTHPNPDDPLVVQIASLLKSDYKGFKTKAEEWTHEYAM
jgi:ubiquitin-conjugating enzyme E2 D